MAVKAMSKDAHVLVQGNFNYHQNECWQFFQCGKIGLHPKLQKYNNRYLLPLCGVHRQV